MAVLAAFDPFSVTLSFVKGRIAKDVGGSIYLRTIRLALYGNRNINTGSSWFSSLDQDEQLRARGPEMMGPEARHWFHEQAGTMPGSKTCAGWSLKTFFAVA